MRHPAPRICHRCHRPFSILFSSRYRKWFHTRCLAGYEKFMAGGEHEPAHTAASPEPAKEKR